MANKRISELTSITGANLADADLLVVVDVSDTTMAASGTNKKVTLNEFAQDSTFSSRYAPQSGDTFWLTPASMAARLGTPALSVAGTNATVHWLFDQSTDESVCWSCVIPSWWTTLNVDFYWTTNVTPTTGNVRWAWGRGFTADGALADSTVADSNVTVAVPATAGYLKVSRVASGVTVAANSMLSGQAIRYGTHVDDTLAGDAILFGILLTRAS